MFIKNKVCYFLCDHWNLRFCSSKSCYKIRISTWVSQSSQQQTNSFDTTEASTLITPHVIWYTKSLNKRRYVVLCKAKLRYTFVVFYSLQIKFAIFFVWQFEVFREVSIIKEEKILRRQWICLYTLEREFHEFPYNSYLFTLPSSVERGDLNLFFPRERPPY